MSKVCLCVPGYVNPMSLLTVPSTYIWKLKTNYPGLVHEENKRYAVGKITEHTIHNKVMRKYLYADSD